MADLIEKGDIVSIYYVDGTRKYQCKVLHVPCDTGDMWYFETRIGVRRIIAQNPLSSNLDYIEKRPDRQPERKCPHDVETQDMHIDNPLCQKCEIQGQYCDFMPF